MKSRIISIFLFFFCLLLVCFSCQDKSTNPKKNLQEANINMVNNNTSAFQISADTAMTRIKKYAEFSDNVSSIIKTNGSYSDSTKFLVYGQKVQIDELKSILSAASDQNNELYIMLGIDNATKETDIVFSLQCDTIQCSDMPILPYWEYFDFTRPCPQYCPEWFSNWKGLLNNK